MSFRDNLLFVRQMFFPVFFYPEVKITDDTPLVVSYAENE